MSKQQNTRRIQRELQHAYRLMFEHFGHQRWWPAETPFEVCVGAILTQNTNWSNVERALNNLKARDLLQPQRLFELPEPSLAELLRPTGYFRIKARRLCAFLSVLIREYAGDLNLLWEGTPAQARARLLLIHGIGPETADSMLLYAGQRLSFVIDGYTRRIFARHAWCRNDSSYDDLQRLCESALPGDQRHPTLDLWQDYHAQLVMVGKHYCRTAQPRCDECPLQALLPG